MNGCVPGLALIERLKATRKWAIVIFEAKVAMHHATSAQVQNAGI